MNVLPIKTEQLYTYAYLSLIVDLLIFTYGRHKNVL